MRPGCPHARYERPTDRPVPVPRSYLVGGPAALEVRWLTGRYARRPFQPDWPVGSLVVHRGFHDRLARKPDVQAENKQLSRFLK